MEKNLEPEFVNLNILWEENHLSFFGGMISMK